MSDWDDLTLPLSRKPSVDPPERAALPEPNLEISRREFLGFTMTAAAGIVLSQFSCTDAGTQQSGAGCVAKVGAELVSPGEIKSANRVLQGVIDLQGQDRAITFYNAGSYGCGEHMLRAYQGYPGFSPASAKPVTLSGVAYPGPTLRAAVGDTIEIILLNRIDPSQFNNTSITSAFGHCDVVHSLSGKGNTGGAPYPGNDKFPNCFHVSNTTNLHWHGTHTDPGGFGDNVLIGVVPNPKMAVAASIQKCAQAYANWGPDSTKRLQDIAAADLQILLEAAKARNDQEMVLQLNAAIENNEANLRSGEWPQYWPGYYPYYIQLPVYSGSPQKFPLMGQAPGTHWYHCHQHGSTTLQLLNGMAGVLVITGDYDDKLLRLGGGTPESPKIKEKVMLFQLFAEQPNQVNRNPSANTVAVNGQVLPTVTMKQGEVQWWRIADAAMKAHGIEQFLFLDESQYQYFTKKPGDMVNGQPPVIDQTKVPALYQTAQDGVQLDWMNYQRRSKPATFSLAPGNRVDFLVQAPSTSGNSYLVFWPPAGGPPPIADIQAHIILKVMVDGAPATENTQLPTQAQYPELPPFLSDIPDSDIHICRKVTFSMTGGLGTQPQFFIDGKQFSEGTVDQTMVKGDAEEWTLFNTSLNSVQHPFHIHINPFQITEIYDPSTMTEPQLQPKPWIWGDTVPIPAGVSRQDADGKTIITPGHVKIRTRFVDYAGKYVLHCHILGHEDRGMMQLVQVIDPQTVVKHH